jgi:hypothetical protein
MTAEYRPKISYIAQNKTRQANKIDFFGKSAGSRFKSWAAHHFFRFVLFFQLIGSCRVSCPPVSEGTEGNNKAATFATARRLDSGTGCVYTRSVVSTSDWPRTS